MYRPGTSQIHLKEMDKVLGMCPPSTPQVHSEFSLPISLQFPQARKWSVHSQCSQSCDHDVPIGKLMGTSRIFPKEVTAMSLSGSLKGFLQCVHSVPRSCDQNVPIRKAMGTSQISPKKVPMMFPSGSFKEFFAVFPAV